MSGRPTHSANGWELLPFSDYLYNLYSKYISSYTVHRENPHFLHLSMTDNNVQSRNDYIISDLGQTNCSMKYFQKSNDNDDDNLLGLSKSRSKRDTKEV